MLFYDLISSVRSLFAQCDEVYPICAHCQRLKLPCSLGAPEPSPDPTTAEKQLNLDDLRLLYDWCKGDGTKFCDHKEDDTSKRSVEIELGLKHPYLLHTILALSALHLCTTREDHSKWYALAISHHGAAIRLARPHIAAQDSSHSDAVFMFSGLNALFAFVEPSLRTLGGDEARGRDYLGDLCDSFRMARGVAMIVMSNQERLQSKGYTNSSAWSYDTESVIPTLGARYPQYRRLQDLIDEHCNESEKACSNDALERLFTSMAVLEDTPKDHSSVSLIQRWPIHLDKAFLDMCENRHPVALVILGYYAVLINLRTNVWFFARWPKILLRTVCNALQDESMRQYLQWPRSQIGRETHSPHSLATD